MGKFIITEREKRQILAKYGLLNEQEAPTTTVAPSTVQNNQQDNDVLPAQRVAWRANQIQSEVLGTSYDDAEKQAYKELEYLFSPEEKVYWRANELQKADPNLSPEDAESKARMELKVPSTKPLQTIQSISAPKPSTSQPSQTQGQQIAANLGKSLSLIGTEGKGGAISNQPVTTTPQSTSQTAPNYNVNYKVLTPQKLTNIRTQINSTGKGNTLTPEDLQALYTTISKLPNKK